MAPIRLWKQYKKLVNLYSTQGAREWCLFKASKSIFGLTRPWPLTPRPPKLTVSCIANWNQNWFIRLQNIVFTVHKFVNRWMNGQVEYIILCLPGWRKHNSSLRRWRNEAWAKGEARRTPIYRRRSDWCLLELYSNRYWHIVLTTDNLAVAKMSRA